MPLLKPTQNPECPVCSKVFGSEQGLSSHLSTARSCKWWKGEPLQHVIGGQIAVHHHPPLPSPTFLDPPSFNWNDPTWPDMEYDNDGSEELEQDELELLRPPNTSETVTTQDDRRPRRALSRALVMDEEAQCIETHPTAGAVLEHRMEVDSNFEESNFHPFSNEVDWRFAEWAIKDSVGHGSLDRLLSIPNVSLLLPILMNVTHYHALGC